MKRPIHVPSRASFPSLGRVRCLHCRRFYACVPSIFLAGLLAYAQQVARPQRQPILAYIKATWPILTRSNRTLAQSAVDPKFPPEPDGRWPVYLPRIKNAESIQRQLQEEMSAPLPPSEQEERLQKVAAARQVLGEEGYAAAFAEGQTWTLEQALDYALEKEG